MKHKASIILHLYKKECLQFSSILQVCELEPVLNKTSLPGYFRLILENRNVTIEDIDRKRERPPKPKF